MSLNKRSIPTSYAEAAKSAGQRELRAARRFFDGKTKRGAAWLRAKCRNRLRVLHVNALAR